MIIEITSDAFGFVIENFYLPISINAIFHTYYLLTYYALLNKQINIIILDISENFYNTLGTDIMLSIAF